MGLTANLDYGGSNPPHAPHNNIEENSNYERKDSKSSGRPSC